MADTEHENSIGVTDRRRTQTQTDLPGTLGTSVNYTDVGSLRTRLAAIDAGYYTSARLDNMTKNDMVYAVRLADDAAGF